MVAVGIDGRRHARAVQHVCLFLVKDYLGAVVQGQAGDGQGAVANVQAGQVARLDVLGAHGGSGDSARRIQYVAHGKLGPQGIGVFAGHAAGFFLGLDVGVLLGAGAGAVNVQHTFGGQKAVDVLALALQGGSHGGVVAPAGRQQNAGGHTQLRVHLADNLAAGLFAIAGHTAHNVCGGHLAGVDLVAVHGQGRGAGGVPNHSDLQGAVRVELSQVVLAQGVGLGGGRAVLYGQTVQQNALQVQGRLFVVQLQGLRGKGLLVGGRVKHVNKNDRPGTKQLERGVHALAQAVRLKVATVAQCLDSLGQAVCQNGGVYRCGGVCGHVDRRCADNDLQAGIAAHRCAHRRGGLAGRNAVIICHFRVPP